MEIKIFRNWDKAKGLWWNKGKTNHFILGILSITLGNNSFYIIDIEKINKLKLGLLCRSEIIDGCKSNEIISNKCKI